MMFNFSTSTPLYLYSIGLKVFAIQKIDLFIGFILFCIGITIRKKFSRLQSISLIIIFLGIFLMIGFLSVT